MKFRVIFEVQPSAQFGLPEAGRTVFPGRPGSFHGPTLHTPTMTLIGHGTLSEYRSSDDRIDQHFAHEGVECRFEDNFAHVELEAEEPHLALSRATTWMDRFLRHLAVSRRVMFLHEVRVLEDEAGTAYPVPRYVEMAAVTTYNLDTFRGALQEAADFQPLRDSRLDRALEYYELALLLYTRRQLLAKPLSRHFANAISSAFLNLWKAITTVVGDPSVRSDRYQRRYMLLGFDESLKPKLDRLKELRDDFDVAHYSLDSANVAVVEKAFGEASVIAAEVLDGYRRYLKRRATVDSA